MTIARQLAPRRELIAWAMYDFANSGYTTVVLTAVFNAYFVSVIADGRGDDGTGTFLWTLAMAVTNLMVILSAPLIGAIADYRADKKLFLAIATTGCVVGTLLLSRAGPGDVVLAMATVVLATYLFAAGEALISGFLPEIAPPEYMGKVSGFAWTVGYLGGLLVLAVCLAYVDYSEARGGTAADYVPVTLWITAAAYGLAALPTFIFLKERASSQQVAGVSMLAVGYGRLLHTLRESTRFTDLFRFLLALGVFYAGIHAVIVLAAVYAQEVLHFSTRDNLILILIVNITAAAGAFSFGMIQDRLGSIRTLRLTLYIWIVALVLAWLAEGRVLFWVAANLIGLALGSSQSAGRALVGQFAPMGRSAEFFGLWSFSTRLAAIVGPITYGLVTWLSQGDHRLALMAIAVFFVAGLLLLSRVNEQRGRQVAAAVD